MQETKAKPEYATRSCTMGTREREAEATQPTCLNCTR